MTNAMDKQFIDKKNKDNLEMTVIRNIISFV